ncbi:MAG: RimK/LysX family protein [Balneolaceae bacterium]|nr:RimK/LysX family protein [Balneolaceae bacterium]
MSSSTNPHCQVIGRLVRVSFDAFGLNNELAKVDTGAYTSSIHCKEALIEGHQVLVWMSSQAMMDETPLRFPLLKTKDVKSSNGAVERRPIIETVVHILGKEYPIQCSLTNRSKMKHRVLIGRRFLKHKFIVDVSLDVTDV